MWFLARSLESKYTPLPAHVDLREVFCMKEYRAVTRDHTISWDGVKYELKSPLSYSIRGQKIEIRTYADLTWRAFFAGKPIDLSPQEAVIRLNPHGTSSDALSAVRGDKIAA